MTPQGEQVSSFSETMGRHERLLIAALIAILVFVAWTGRFIQDDAFISFRYAKNLVDGHGLVWNIGEPIEGYTNFLWVLVIALGFKLGAEPVLWSQSVGLWLFAGTLWFTFRLVREVVDDALVALVAILALATNYTVSMYATGGLETQLQAFLCVVVAERTASGLRRKTWAGREIIHISLAMAGALLTRLDSAIVCALAGLFCLHAWRNEASGKFLKRAALLVLPALFIVGAWLAWKLWYYGDLLPNTFRVKGSFDTFSRGAWYLHRFAMSYLLYPLFLVSAMAARRFFTTTHAAATMLALMVGALTLYIASVGGDFMEFRFLVTALWLSAPLGAWLFSAYVTHRGARIAMLALLAYGSLHHATTFRYDSFYEIEPKEMLEGHLTNPKEQWTNVGKTLGKALDYDPAIRIAVTAAGSIPYYSGLTTIDMLGLSDRFVPTGGIVIGTRPGHRRIAPLSYLRERGVHLAISHPTIVPIDAPTFVAPFLPRFALEPLPDVPLLEIPLDASQKLIVWYLLPDGRIDAAIAREHWKLSRVAADTPSDPSSLK